MANKPELKRAVAGSKIKANDYNYNFEQLNNYIENGIADNAINKYEADREYSKDDLVSVEIDGVFGIYRSLVDGNKGQSLLDGNFWKRENFIKDFEERFNNFADGRFLSFPFTVNAGNTDEKGNADLLYLPEMGDVEIPWQSPTLTTLTDYGTIEHNGFTNVLQLFDGSTELQRISTGTSNLTWKFPSDKRISINGLNIYWGGQGGVSGGAYSATLTLYKNGEVVNTISDLHNGSTAIGWYYNTFSKTECDQINLYIDGYNLSDVPTRIGEIQFVGTEIVTISASTGCYFKVGGDYPNLVATSTEKTFEKSYLKPITAETDGTYNVFISETENPYALANTIYRQKTEPTANTNDVWLNTSTQPYKAYKFNGTVWEDFKDVPIGSMVVEGGIITSVETLPYNNAGVNEPSDTRPAVVVETYQNGSSWYRIYSDGWCEQGGAFGTGVDTTATLTLLKPYKDTNYQIGYVGCGENSNTLGASWINQMFYPQTNSTAVYRIINYNRWWHAEGYIR